MDADKTFLEACREFHDACVDLFFEVCLALHIDDLCRLLAQGLAKLHGR